MKAKQNLNPDPKVIKGLLDLNNKRDWYGRRQLYFSFVTARKVINYDEKTRKFISEKYNRESIVWIR